MKKIMRIKNIFILVITISFLLSMAACGSGGSNTTSGETDLGMDQGQDANIIVNEIQGEVRIDGSSTMFPISEFVTREFNKAYPNVMIHMGVAGTNSGFKKYIRGKLDICNASSPMSELQRQDASDEGIESIELVVAKDAILVVVNKENSALESIQLEELKKIWEAESVVAKWNEVNEKWPDSELNLYAPTGEAESFSTLVKGDSADLRPDYLPSEDGSGVIESVAADKNAMGLISYEDYLKNKDGVKVLGIDSGNGAVYPEETTIKDGTYTPLTRNLYMYVNKKSLENEVVQKYVEFFLGDGTKLIKEAGSIPLDDYSSELAKIK